MLCVALIVCAFVHKGTNYRLETWVQLMIMIRYEVSNTGSALCVWFYYQFLALFKCSSKKICAYILYHNTIRLQDSCISWRHTPLILMWIWSLLFLFARCSFLAKSSFFKDFLESFIEKEIVMVVKIHSNEWKIFNTRNKEQVFGNHRNLYWRNSRWDLFPNL